MNKAAFMSMDVESFYDTSCVKKAGIKGTASCADGIGRFLGLMDKYGIKATLFLTGEFIGECEDILKQAVKDGHELAVHCYSHLPPLQQDYETFTEQIKKTVGIIEEKFSVKPAGYRAPCFGIDGKIYSFISGEGFLYDSSALNYKGAINSGGIDLSKFNKINDAVYEKDGFYEFKPCVAKRSGRGVPVSGGGYVRLIPWFLIKRIINKYIKSSDAYLFYVHPFEVSESKIPRMKELSFGENAFVTCGRKSYLKKLEYIIGKLKEQNYSFYTMKQYIDTLKTD